MFDLKENYKISRDIATGGMVLLKNEEKTLPFTSLTTVGIIGKDCLDLIKGGGGSASVKCEYTRTLLEGLSEKEKEGKLKLCRESFKLAEETENYEIASLNALAAKMDTAIVTLRRFGTEGDDRPIGKTGDELDTEHKVEFVDIETYEGQKTAYYLYRDEVELLDKIESSDIKSVVLLLNIAATMDLTFIQKYTKIKAILLTYLPGMECGAAIADVLSGDVTPSGKLVDTVPLEYCDLPSAKSFNSDLYVSKYEEDIFVGYRYFETYAKDRVLYPFGFGLSYTEFEYTDGDLRVTADGLVATVTVKNVGGVRGREVVQIYAEAPAGKIKKPKIVLTGFSKTCDIMPGESRTVEIAFPYRNMASFDAGEGENPGAWVLEGGEYKIFAGKSSRDITPIGSYKVEKTTVLEQQSLRFGGQEYEFRSDFSNCEWQSDREGLSFYDVMEGRLTLKEFVNRLTPEELVWLARGQAIGFPAGTSGMGDIRYLDIPNPQTADGPVGIRRSINSTCFPAATLVAASWDSELQEAMGRALGFEGYSTGIDVILGPAMNIHRDPLGGRCFEYFSEDPLVSGKAAAYIVRGVESEGMLATLKHYAVNSCEFNRNSNSSEVSERALREIYLRGFEIAVKESNPAFIMSSYNLLNGIHTSAHAQLLRGMLRDEWNYEGAVMTDWRNGVPLKDEIIAGNNIKMPLGYPDEAAKTLEAYRNGEISLAHLRDNAYYVLLAITKSRSYKVRDFGLVHKLEGDSLYIPALKVNGISCARVNHDKREDGVDYFYCLNLDQRNQRSFVTYAIDVKEGGEFKVDIEFATDTPTAEIWLLDDKENRIATYKLSKAEDKERWYTESADISLKTGENIIKVVFALEPLVDREYFCPRTEVPNEWPDLSPEDIQFVGLNFKRK